MEAANTMKKRNNQQRQGGLIALTEALRSPTASIILDLLVIVSLIMNFYSFWQSMNVGGELNRINSQLTVLNQTLEKSALDLSTDNHPTPVKYTEQASCQTDKQT
jgi:hypothetical protein